MEWDTWGALPAVNALAFTGSLLLARKDWLPKLKVPGLTYKCSFCCGFVLSLYCARVVGWSIVVSLDCKGGWAAMGN